MKLNAIRTRIRQGNAVDAIHNRLAVSVGRPRRLLRRPHTYVHWPSSRRINRLVSELPTVTEYLEIGLYLGITFESIDIRERVGVDPFPMFDTRRLPAGTRVIRTTSDEFFAALPATERFDIVFVDGLHTYEQTYRDVINSFNRLSPGGVVLVDDVIPIDAHSAIRDEHEARRSRAAGGDTPVAWHGDVFKVVKILADHHPEIAIRTIVGSGNPQALMWRRSVGMLTTIDEPALMDYMPVAYEDVFSPEGASHLRCRIRG